MYENEVLYCFFKNQNYPTLSSSTFLHSTFPIVDEQSTNEKFLCDNEHDVGSLQ